MGGSTSPNADKQIHNFWTGGAFWPPHKASCAPLCNATCWARGGVRIVPPKGPETAKVGRRRHSIIAPQCFSAPSILIRGPRASVRSHGHVGGWCRDEVEEALTWYLCPAVQDCLSLAPAAPIKKRTKVATYPSRTKIQR